MELSQTDSLKNIAAHEWNRLVGEQNPFVRYEFLAALEEHDCLHPFGWQPLHLLVHEAGKLVGAMPLYAKSNAYGEFVFDWAWASAYERSGKQYYPKLVCAVPYTPATGPRLLVAQEADAAAVKKLLLHGALQFTQSNKLSSAHFLFTDAADTQWLQNSGLMLRLGVQFHWENQGYRDFADYLDQFTSKKRKQIKRERRDAQHCGVAIEILDGHTATAEHWRVFHHFYSSTFERKSGVPTLSLAFFQSLAQTMPDKIVLVMARDRQGYVAGAFNLRGSDTLFGRHYGCSEHYRHLHFEVCYYQTLDYCLSHGLQRFEAGAQGEHKLSRGFLPTATWSAHYLLDAQFSQMIQRFLSQETEAMQDYLKELSERTPFKQSH